MAAAPKIPSSADIAELLTGLSDEESCRVLFGGLYVIEDPSTHKVELVDAMAATSSQKQNRIDFGKHLDPELMNKVLSPEAKAMIGDSFRMAAQMRPELVAAARNEVRSNQNRLPIVEVGFAKEPRDVIVGRVTAQNDTQTILTRSRKGMQGEPGRVEEMIVFDNEAFLVKPKVTESVSIQRDAKSGLYKSSPLVNANAQKGGLAQ